MILTLKSLWPLFTMFLTSSVGGSVKKLSVAQFRISNASPINNMKRWKYNVFKILYCKMLVKKSLVRHFYKTYLEHNCICYKVQTLLRIRMSRTSCCLILFCTRFLTDSISAKLQLFVSFVSLPVRYLPFSHLKIWCIFMWYKCIFTRFWRQRMN